MRIVFAHWLLELDDNDRIRLFPLPPCETRIIKQC